MEHLLDAVITQAYKAKKTDGSFVEGEGDYGAWRLYNFYTDKTGDKKFGFMWGTKKPIPYEGLKIKHLEYEVEIKGKYTNYNAKTIEMDPDTPAMKAESQPKPQASNNNGDSGPVSMYKSYMKDIANTIIAAGGDITTVDLDFIARKVGRAGVILMQEGMDNNVPEKPQNVPDEPYLTPEEVANSFKDVPEEPQNAPESTQTETPRDTSSSNKANDPRKDLIRCEVVKEDGTLKHGSPVSAIFCLTSCMETKHCSMARNLREKYPGYNKE